MTMRTRTVVGIGTAALVGIAAAKARRVLSSPAPETGTFANGMDFARWGDGRRTMVWIPGGPGSDAPRGVMGALSGRQFQPLIDNGFSVWLVTRRRNMPAGHTVADMADDYADLINDQFGGHVDAVVGLSYGGMIAQYLATNHPDRVDRVVLALSAMTVSGWGADVDHRWAQARAQGRQAEAGLVMAEYIFPDPGQQRQRRLVGPLLRGMTAGEHVPSGDLLVEAEAELVFDSHDALPRITVPVLLISGGEDMFFTPQIIDETVALIPDCTSIQYEGLGHLRAATSSRLAQDILEWVSPQPEG